MTADQILDSIRRLAVGAMITFDGGLVKRCRPDAYILAVKANSERCRWGDVHQITVDAEYYLTYGCLPPASGPHW